MSAREPGVPEDSESWDWTIIGERPLKGEAGLRVDMETRLDGEGEEGGVGDWLGPGARLRGGDGSLRGGGEPPEVADAEASRRLRANRALLALAELLWPESLAWLGSGPIGCPPS